MDLACPGRAGDGGDGAAVYRCGGIWGVISGGVFVFVLVVFGVWDLAVSAFVITLSVYMLIVASVVLLGALTGAILGWLSKRLLRVVSKQRFVQLGILVCIILAAVLHIAFFIGIPSLTGKYWTEPFAPSLSIREYWILIGVPSIIYIVSGAWISRELWLKS